MDCKLPEIIDTVFNHLVFIAITAVAKFYVQHITVNLSKTNHYDRF